MKIASIAAIAALSFALSAKAQAPYPPIAIPPVESPTAWASNVDPSGWEFVGSSDDKALAMFVRNAIGASTNGKPRLWLRFESRNGPYFSEIQLYEFDCVHGSAHYTSWTQYTQHNMTGEGYNRSDPTNNQDIAPGTMLHAAFRKVCPK